LRRLRVKWYNAGMTRAYEEIIDFIARGSTPTAVAQFQPSDETRTQVGRLLERQKMGLLSDEEQSELDHYLELEHIMRLAKARARARLAS
jgi:hypothetical protein